MSTNSPIAPGTAALLGSWTVSTSTPSTVTTTEESVDDQRQVDPPVGLDVGTGLVDAFGVGVPQPGEGPVGIGEVLDRAEVPRGGRVERRAVERSEVHRLEVVTTVDQVIGEAGEPARVVRRVVGESGSEIDLDRAGTRTRRG